MYIYLLSPFVFSVHRPGVAIVPAAAFLPLRGSQDGRHARGVRIRVRNRKSLTIFIQVQ